jgi:multidrug efflux pump subunit AcrB
LTRQQNQVAHRFSVSVLAVLVLCFLRWGHVGIAGRALVATASALGATVLTLVLWGRAVPIAALVVLSLAVGPLAMLAGGDSAGAPRPPFLRLAPWGYRVSAPLLWLAMVLPIGFLTPAVRSRLVPPLVALLALVLWHAACAASVAGVAPVSALARSQRCPRGRGPLALGGVRVLRRTGRLRARRGMRRLIRRPAWAITLTVAWTVGGFWYGMTALASTPRQADAPDGSTLRLEVTAPRGTDPALVDAVVRPFERLAMADPVAGITRASGAGAEAQVLVEIDPATPGATAPQRLQARFVARATQVGGMALLVQGTGPAYHAGDDGRGHSAFRLQLAGYQWEPLDSLATALVARLERMPRVRDVRVSSSPWRETPPGREILIQPDRGTMARLGLPIHDMAATVAGDAGGLVGRLTLPIGGDDQPVSVREDGAALRTLTRLGETPVPTSRGLRVRLRDVATFREHTIPMAIEREAQRYVRYVHYEIRGTPRRAQRIQSGLRATLAPPPGFTITDVSAGADPDAEAPFERSWRMGLLGIVLAGLAAAVRSDRRRTAAVVWLVLPSVLAGALIARARFGQSLTPESLAGLVLAGGVAAQLAAARSAGATDRWWVLLGTVASTGPFLMTGGAETPGQLTAAVVLGGIGGSTVALALAGPLVRGRIH